jgi:hypothetical protein
LPRIMNRLGLRYQLATWETDDAVSNPSSDQVNGARTVPDPDVTKATCETCKGTGTHRLAAFKEGFCQLKNPKPVAKTPPHPCPDCRPAEYFVAVGGALRKEGHYLEAMIAALTHWDEWAMGDTMLAWDIDVSEAKSALRKAGWNVSMKELTQYRRTSLTFPPDKRDKYSWKTYEVAARSEKWRRRIFSGPELSAWDEEADAKFTEVMGELAKASEVTSEEITNCPPVDANRSK